MVEGDPPSTTVDARSGAAGTLILNRRTRHRAIRAEHAALTFDRLHAVAAVLAIVDVTAGVRRHGLKCLVATGRTSNDGKQFHGSSPGPGRANARLDPVAAPASIGPKADTIKNGPMPPRIDLEPLENDHVEGKDGRERCGGYPHGPPKKRGNFGPTATILRGPPHTSYELRDTTWLSALFSARSRHRAHEAVRVSRPPARSAKRADRWHARLGQAPGLVGLLHL